MTSSRICSFWVRTGKNRTRARGRAPCVPVCRVGYFRESVHRTHVEIGGALADLSAVLGPLFDRLAEVKPDEDARIGILGRRLREAGKRAEYRRRIAAGAASRQRRAAVLEADLVGAEELLQHFSTRAAFNRVTRGVVLVRRSRAKRCPCRVTDRIRVAVRVPFLNSGDRSPVVVVVLGIGHGDIAVRKRHVEQPEKPGILPECRVPGRWRRFARSGSISAGSFPTRRGRFRFGRRCDRWE